MFLARKIKMEQQIRFLFWQDLIVFFTALASKILFRSRHSEVFLKIVALKIYKYGTEKICAETLFCLNDHSFPFPYKWTLSATFR